MPFGDTVRRAAERYGVQQEFWDIFGKLHTTTPETNRAILTALGFDCASEESLAAGLARRDREEWRRLLPPVAVGSETSLRIPVRTPRSHDHVSLEIRLENGDSRCLPLDLRSAKPVASAHFDGIEWVERHVDPGVKLPLGYHEARSGDSAMRLIVTPDCAYAPAPGKHAGLGITLYGLRSRHNWGCGDFRDLRALIDWAVPALHAQFIALNPLHAIKNRTPYNASPYLPNSIFYRNFIYLDVEAVPGFEMDAATGREIEKLRATEHVEYEAVAAIKRRALQRVFDTHPPGDDCRRWVDAEGDLLRLFATYCALDEHLHAADPNLWVWPEWPQEYRDPNSGAVSQFAKRHERQILFHGWLQWLIDGQIAAVQKHAKDAGMSLGLYHDLALATDRCGSDLWAHRPFYINGARVGSPPDGFSPSGQDWSFSASRREPSSGERIPALY